MSSPVLTEEPAAPSVPHQSSARATRSGTAKVVLTLLAALLVAAAFVIIAGAALVLGARTTADSEEAIITGAEPAAIELRLDTPRPGNVFPSGSRIVGFSTSPIVAYRLSGGDNIFAEGSIGTVDGRFDTTLDFTNTCCIEISLAVFDPGTGEGFTIPLAFPEPDGSADPAAESVDMAAFIDRFAADWAAANWTAMETYAVDPVIDVARSAWSDGLTVSVIAPVYSTGAELLVVDPASPPGRLFVAATEVSGGQTIIAMLVPAGDAG